MNIIERQDWDGMLHYARRAQDQHPTRERELFIKDLEKMNEISEQKSEVARLTKLRL